MITLQATDTIDTVNEAAKTVQRITQENVALGVLAFVVVVGVGFGIAYMFIRLKREDKQAKRDEEYKTQVTGKLGEISSGIIVTTAKVEQHEKEISENRHEIRAVTTELRGLDKAVHTVTTGVANLADQVKGFVNAMNEMPHIKRDVEDNKREIRELKKGQSEIQNKL